jgi:hypothetical protein
LLPLILSSSVAVKSCKSAIGSCSEVFQWNSHIYILFL